MRKEGFQAQFIRSALFWFQNQTKTEEEGEGEGEGEEEERKKKEIIGQIHDKHRCKNSQQNISKLDPAYTKEIIHHDQWNLFLRFNEDLISSNQLTWYTT